MPEFPEQTLMDSSYRGHGIKLITPSKSSYTCNDIDYKLYLYNQLSNSQIDLDISNTTFGNNVYMKLNSGIKLYHDITSNILYDCAIASAGVYKKDATSFGYNPNLYCILFDSSTNSIIDIKIVNLMSNLNSNTNYEGHDQTISTYPKEYIFSATSMVSLDETSAVLIDFGGLEKNIDTNYSEGTPESGGQTNDIMADDVNYNTTYLSYGNAGAISDDGRYALFYGGTYSVNGTKTYGLWFFDLVDQTMIPFDFAPCSNTAPNTGHICTYQDGTFYLLEGCKNTYADWNYDVFSFDRNCQGANSFDWVKVSGDGEPGNGMSEGCAVLYDSQYLYVFGGYYVGYPNDPYADVQRWDMSTLTQDADMIGSMTYPIYGAHAAISGNKTYITGGRSNSTTKTNYFQIYNMVNNTCSLGTSLPASIADHVSQIVDNTLYIQGGGLDHLYCIDLSNVNGSQEAIDETVSSWYGCGIAVYDGTAYIFGGSPVDGYSNDQIYGLLKSYEPFIPAQDGTEIPLPEIVLDMNNLKYKIASGLVKKNNIGNEYSAITVSDSPSIRFGHAITTIASGKALMLGGAFDTTLLNFHNLYDTTIADYTSVNVYDLSGQYEVNDNSITISSGDLGLESILTDKINNYDFGDATSAGEDGQYARFIELDQTSILCAGIFIEVAGGAKSRCVIHLIDHTETIYDEITLPPFYYEWVPDDSQESYNVCVYLDIPKGTVIKSKYWVKYTYS